MIHSAEESQSGCEERLLSKQRLLDPSVSAASEILTKEIWHLCRHVIVCSFKIWSLSFKGRQNKTQTNLNIRNMATETKTCSKTGRETKAQVGYSGEENRRTATVIPGTATQSHDWFLHHPEVHIYTGHVWETTCGLSFTHKVFDLLLNWKYRNTE